MASKFLAKLILVVGIILLAHSAYSTYECTDEICLFNLAPKVSRFSGLSSPLKVIMLTSSASSSTYSSRNYSQERS